MIQGEKERPVTRPDQSMTVFEAILARRSVRAYAPQPLDRGAVQTLLEAAVRAPTAMHEEPWAFAVVQDKQALKKISDRAKPIFVEEARPRRARGGGHSFEIFSRPDFNIFYDAGALIVICAKPLGQFTAADCWLAAENLMLAACSMGLGTCVIGSALAALNLPDVKSELGIPAEFSAVAPITIGVPRDETAASSRKEPRILSWM
jgi:nitroreductase